MALHQTQMIIFDDEIMEASIQKLQATKKELNIIFYSISPYSNTNPIRFRAWWLQLIATTKRIESTRVILSGWKKSNPQHISQMKAAMQLTQAGAKVKIGHDNMIIHPKTMCFDDKFLLIGSHNATEAGYTRTKNISIITSDALAIGGFLDYFENRWDSIT